MPSPLDYIQKSQRKPKTNALDYISREKSRTPENYTRAFNESSTTPADRPSSVDIEGINSAAREVSDQVIKIEPQPSSFDRFKSWLGSTKGTARAALFKEDGLGTDLVEQWKGGAKALFGNELSATEKAQAVYRAPIELSKGLGGAAVDFAKITLPRTVASLVRIGGDKLVTDSEGVERDPLNPLTTPSQLSESVLRRNKAVDKWLDTQGEKVQEWSEKVLLGLDETARERAEEYNVGEGSFFDPKSFGYQFGSGASSLAAAAGITLATKNPTAGAMVLGFTEGLPTYNDALRKIKLDNPKMSDDEAEQKALRIALVETGGIVYLEKLGLEALFKSMPGTTRLKRATIGSLTETMQETSQTIWSNGVEKYGFDETKGLFDDVFETIIITMPLGFIAGGVLPKGSLDEDSKVVKDIRSSEALPIKESIESGDIKATDVYKNGESGTLTPEFAEGRFNDIAQKLGRENPALETEFRNRIDVNNTSMEEMVDTALDLTRTTDAIDPTQITYEGNPRDEEEYQQILEQVSEKHPNIESEYIQDVIDGAVKTVRNTQPEDIIDPDAIQEGEQALAEDINQAVQERGVDAVANELAQLEEFESREEAIELIERVQEAPPTSAIPNDILSDLEAAAAVVRGENAVATAEATASSEFNAELANVEAQLDTARGVERANLEQRANELRAKRKDTDQKNKKVQEREQREAATNRAREAAGEVVIQVNQGAEEAGIYNEIIKSMRSQNRLIEALENRANSITALRAFVKEEFDATIANWAEGLDLNNQTQVDAFNSVAKRGDSIFSDLMGEFRKDVDIAEDSSTVDSNEEPSNRDTRGSVRQTEDTTRDRDGSSQSGERGSADTVDSREVAREPDSASGGSARERSSDAIRKSDLVTKIDNKKKHQEVFDRLISGEEPSLISYGEYGGNSTGIFYLTVNFPAEYFSYLEDFANRKDADARVQELRETFGGKPNIVTRKADIVYTRAGIVAVPQTVAIAEKQNNPLAKVVVELIEQEGLSLQDASLYTKIENEPYMPLSIERLNYGYMGADLVAMMHSYEQNGDLMRDPEVVFRIEDNGQLTPVSIETSPYPQRDIAPNDEFLKIWADNLRSQGFIRTESDDKKKKAVDPGKVNRNAIRAAEADLRAVYLETTANDEFDGYTQADEVLSQILTELELAEPGERVFIDGEVRGVPSTFPKWVPDNARNRDDLNWMIEAFADVRGFSYPSGRNETKRRLFADALFEELDYQLDVSTSVIREKILSLYETTEDQTPQALEGDTTQGEDGATRSEEETLQRTGSTKEELEQLINDYAYVTAEGRVELVNNKQPTQAVLKQINGWVPAGGRESEGAEGRGLLDEYYTPPEATRMVEQLLLKNEAYDSMADIKVLEPSVGTGNFLNNIPNFADITAYEINETSAKIAKLNHPNATVVVSPFEGLFMDTRGNRKTPPEKFDIVVGNPPYGKHRGKYKGLGEEPKIARYETYFIKRSLDLTKEGGYVAMVVPSSFVRSGSNEAGKAEIAKLGKLVSAVRLPNGAFDTTGIGTDILVFKRDTAKDDVSRISRVRTMSDDTYFRSALNRDHVLGTEEMMSGRFGQEPGVKGNLDDAWERFTKTEFYEEAAMEVDTTPNEVVKTEREVAEKEYTQAQNKLNNERRSKEAQEQPAKLEAAGLAVGDSVVRHSADGPIEGTIVTPDGSSVAYVEHEGGQEMWNENWYKPTEGTETVIEQKQLEDAQTDLDQDQWQYVTPTGELEGDFDPDQAYYMDGKYYNEFNYVQGDIYTKLDQLERDKSALTPEKYKRQKKALEAVKPKPMTVDRMRIPPHARFTELVKIDGETLQNQFLSWIKTLPINAFGLSSEFDVRNYTLGNAVRGGDKQQNEITRRTRRTEGDKLFKLFLTNELSDANRAKVEEQFNRRFNAIHKPDYKQVPLVAKLSPTFKGRELEVREVQRQGVGFLINRGVGLLAHDVGLGKTMQGIIVNIELLERGWAKRPLIVLPSASVYRQWLDEIRELKPDIKINELSNLGADFKGDLKTLAIPDGTLSVMTEEGFKKLGFSDETYNDLTKDLFDAIEKPGKKTKRAEELERAKVEETIGKGAKGTSAERTFEELGFDAITVDEIHNYNHIIASAKAADEKKVTEFRGFSQQPSVGGTKLWLAAQYIQKQNNGRNVIGLSATPFTNHPLEYYSILSLFARERLTAMGIRNVNDFMAMFMDVVAKDEVRADGTLASKLDVRGFNNAVQFQSLLREFIDFRDGEEAGIVRPTRNSREFIVPENRMSYDYKQMAQELFNDKEAGTLKAMTELQKIAFSPYTSKYHNGPIPTAQEFVNGSPKIKLATELLAETYRNVKDSNHIIYSNRGKEYLPLIKQYLSEEYGIPEGEIELITGSTAKGKRTDIQNRFNQGKVRVIIGNEAIEEGINLQEKTTDLYILSQPWNFTAVRQVIGRAWRQGNQWKNVRINQFFTENTFDIFLSQAIEKKRVRYQESLRQGADYVDAGDIQYDELKGDLMTDPVMRTRVEFKEKRARLETDIQRTESDFAQKNRKNKEYVEAYGKIVKWQTRLAEKPGEEWLQRNLQNARSNFEELKTSLKERGIDIASLEAELAETEKTIAVLQEELKSLEEEEKKALEAAKIEAEVQVDTTGDVDYQEHVNNHAEDNNRLFLNNDPMFMSLTSEEVTTQVIQYLRSELSSETISRQGLENILNRPGIKQVEKDMFRSAADQQNRDTLDVADLITAVRRELLDIYSGNPATGDIIPDFEIINLKDEERGNVDLYSVKIYESDIENTAGEVHFGHSYSPPEYYFAHTRIEDMADGNTRRVIEVQSDLFQKDGIKNHVELAGEEGAQAEAKLQPYRNTWWEYVLRKEIKEAAGLGKHYLQLPVGETAMKIEGLGSTESWFYFDPESNDVPPIVGPLDLEEGLEITQNSYANSSNDAWVITEVLDDGKFKAVTKRFYDESKDYADNIAKIKDDKEFWKIMRESQNNETFDISGKVDTSNPIYKFYEQNVGKWAKNNYGAERVTDEQGVEWWQMRLTPEIAERPIYAFNEVVPTRDRQGRFTGSLSRADQRAQVRQAGFVPETNLRRAEEDAIYRFRMTAKDGQTLKNRLNNYKKRFNLKFDVDLADRIFIQGDKVRNKILSETEAYGVYFDNAIVLANEGPMTTGDHEMVHLVFDHLSEIEAFSGFTKEQLLTAANAGESIANLPAAELRTLEEKVAVGFERFLIASKIDEAKARRRWGTTLGEFYLRLKRLVLDLYRTFGGPMSVPIDARTRRTIYDVIEGPRKKKDYSKMKNPLYRQNMDVLADFYDTLLRGESKDTEKTVFLTNPVRQAKVKFETSEGLKYYDFAEIIQNRRDVDNAARGAMFSAVTQKEDPVTNKVFENEDKLNFILKDINVLEDMTAQSRDLFLKDPEQFTQADAIEKVGQRHDADKEKLDQNFADTLESYTKLKAPERERVNEVLWKGDALGKEFSDNELVMFNLTTEQIKAYKDVRYALDTAHELLLLEMGRKGIDQVEIETFRQERQGYMPHKWKYPYVVQHQAVRGRGWATVQMESFKSEKLAIERQQELAAKNDNPDVRYAVDKLSSLEVDFFSSMELSSERMVAVIEQMRDEGYVKDRVVDILRKNLMDMFKEKGFGRHYLRRTGVGGFDTDNTEVVLANYFSGFSGYVTKMRWSGEYFNVLSQVDARRQPKFFAWMRDLVAYKLNNKSEWRAVRTIAFAWYLANDLSYLITNATQNWTVGMGELSKYVEGSDKAWKPEAYLLKATNDWALKRVSAEERAVIDGLLEEGQLGAEMTSELMGFANNPLYKEISTKFNKVMYKSTAIVEQNINRVPAFLAARRIFIEQGMSAQMANTKALEVSNDIHFRYGRHHRPRIMRGKINVIFIFQHYIRSLLYQLYRDASRGEFIALSRKMMYTVLLGGATALPFAKLMLEIFRGIADDEDDEELKEEMALWQIAIERGIPAAILQIDLSSRVGIELLSVNKIYESPADVRTYLGAIGDLIFKRPFQVADLVVQQRFSDALAKGLPDMFANPIRAYNGYRYGVRSISGTPLFDHSGEIYKYNGWEAIIKATGFTPTQEAMLWDEKSRQWDRDAKAQEKRTTVRRTIQGMVTRGELDEARETQEQAKEEGIISDRTDYVREFAEEQFFTEAIEAYEASQKRRGDIDRIEDELIEKIYNGVVTDRQINNVRKEFAIYRQYGMDNDDVNAIMKARTNADRVQLLLALREDMGEEAFNDFFKTGRSKITTQAGSRVPILFSDALTKEFQKALKNASQN